MSVPDHSDHVGRDRLFRNVIAGWLAQIVAVVIGFVMPRLILDGVGPAPLGIWDLGWSLVSYVAYSGLGMSGAIAWRVARARAEGDERGIGEATATGSFCQSAFALVAGALVVGLFVGVGHLLPGSSALPVEDIDAIGLLLGLTVFVGLLGGCGQGLLNGFHRVDLNEYVTIASDTLLAAAMITVLLLGGGILGLAWVTLLTRLAAEIARAVLAAWVCPGADLHPSRIRRQHAVETVRFAVKSSTAVAHEVLIQQGARVALALTAGPVALAAYSRYATLIRQIVRVVERSLHALPALTSGMVGAGREGDVRQLSLRAGNAVVLLLLPMTVLFAVLGDELVEVWMGREFVIPGLSWLFAIMAAVSADRTVAQQVLSGLNAHGRIALHCLGISLLIFLLAIALLYPLDPLRTALAVTATVTVGYAVPHFLLSCERLDIPVLEHLRKVYLRPLISNAFFLAFLIWAEAELAAGDYVETAIALALGCISLAILYWFYAFDADLRHKVLKRLPWQLARPG